MSSPLQQQQKPTIEISSSTDSSSVTSSCAEYGLTTSEFHALREKVVEAKKSAYCPYSNFRVGAVLLTHSGSYIPGANVENASYPVTTCAERVAFGKAITEGYRGFKAVAVATDISPPASPCGMCRQCIREFCDLSVPIIMFDGEEKYTIMRLEQLLPLSFGPEALGVPAQLSTATSQ